MYNGSKISDFMQQSLEEMKKHVATLYSQEDVLAKLNEVYVRRYFSDFASLKCQLGYIFKARNFTEDEIECLLKSTPNNFDTDYFKNLIIERFPTKQQLIVTLIEDMYKIYSSFPPEEKFLARIVKRLADQDFSDEDSLRMQILKRFVRHTEYHIKGVEAIILNSISDKERKKYEKLCNEQKKEFLISHLTENIFTPLDVIKVEDYIKFFGNWLNNDSHINYFTLNPFVVADGTSIDDNLERNFVEYLSKYNVVEKKYKIEDDSTVTETIECVCRRDELYKKDKITFIKKYGDIFEVLKIAAGIGKFCNWNLKEYAAFLVALINSNPPKKKDWLLVDLHEQLVELVRTLIKTDIERVEGVTANANATIQEKVDAAIKDISIALKPLELLKHIINLQNTPNASKNRIQLFENIEKAFSGLNSDYFKKFKTEYLFKNYEENFYSKCKSISFGTCGATEDEFKDFLTEQIASNKPIPYDLPDVLSLTNFTTDNGIKIITDYLKTNNLTVYDIQKMTLFYLKQFRLPAGNTYANVGEIFNRAFKDKQRTWRYLDYTLMKIANDLASAKFDINGKTKKALYLFAFAFDMKFNTGANTVSEERDIEKNLFQDFYNDDFLRYEKPPTGEGINFKNVIEVIYLYFLNKTDFTPAEKLDKAEQFIENVFAEAQRNRATFKVLPMTSSAYRQKFFDEALNMDENNFRTYLLNNYKIYSANSTESNNRIMLASEMRTVKKVLQEIVKKINAYPALTIEEEWPEQHLYIKILAALELIWSNNELKYGIAGVFIDDLIATLTDLNNQQFHDAELEKILLDEKFIAALKKMEDTLDVNKRILKNDDFFQSTRYTRSDLIALYYYYFCNFVVSNLIDGYKIKDVQELADMFLESFVDEKSEQQDGLNRYLGKCGFTLFSPKILYDLFIIFFLYLELFW